MTISKRNVALFAAFSTLFVLILIFQEAGQELRIKTLNTLRTPLLIFSKTTYALRNLPEFINLKEANKILKDENEALKLQVLKLREAALENQRLKEFLEFKKERGDKFLVALVIGREAVSWRASVIISRGKRDGARTGSVVLKGEGLVGRVTEVGPTISRVVLITDPDSGVSAVIQRNRVEGLVTGRPVSGLIMKYLPLDADVKPNDLVVTSGLGSVFTKGLLIGEVIAVKKDSSGLFKNAELRPAVDLERLEEVLVVK